MKKIMIQFHAASEELMAFVKCAKSELKLFATVMTSRPFTIKVISDEFSISNFSPEGDIRVLFTREVPNTSVLSSNSFYDLNPGSIGLHVGRLTNNGLEESGLAFMSDDKEKILLANSLASKIKKVTKSGAISVNPVTGAEAIVRSHRYTVGAKALYDKGVKILPVAGHCFYRLPD